MQLYKYSALRPLLSLGDILLRTPRVSATEWQALPALVRWLVMVRAVVLVMTASSALIGILPALGAGQFHPLRLAALILGLICAHATNNLINDYVDARQGLDTNNYFRRQYGVHVLEDGLVSKAEFWRVTLLTAGVALVCGLWLAWSGGAAVWLLMAAGAFFVVFYTWPLKHFALGELAVLLVWGPLMTAGSYYVMTGSVTPGIVLLSVVYGIGPTLVILGKHIDKVEQDSLKGVRSLPVVLGEEHARRVSMALLVIQWLLLAMGILAHALPVWCLLTLLSLPAGRQLVTRFRLTRPTLRPESYPQSIWPLWYSAFAFRYSRDFGILLVIALAIAAAGF